MKAHEKIYKELKKYGVKHPEVFKGWHSTTLKAGWHYIEFGRSDAVRLGGTKAEALERIELMFESH